MKKILILFLFVAFLPVFSWAIEPPQQKIRLEADWLFLQSDLGNSWEAVRPKQKEDVPIWTAVTLPHCFNATDAVNPYENYYQGPGWYKTRLTLDNPYPNGRTILHFEGAGQKTEVYIYTTLVGMHTGGYDEWTVDITDAVADFRALPDAVRFEGKVPLSIRCDNSRDAEMIPSDLSDFNLYGGLYRPLNLIYTPVVSLDDLAIQTIAAENLKTATLSVSGSLYTPAGIPEDTHVEIVVRDPHGKIVTQERKTIGNTTSKLLEIEVKNPTLWSPASPMLYTCEAVLHTGGKEIRYRKHFGFRTYEFIEHGGFKLNGQPLMIRGTHRHEDHAGVAAAMTDEMIRAEMQMIRDMGANFIRLGHYQQSELALHLCDSLGLMVWEEIPWCRGGLGDEVYKQQARDMLTAMIRQHRNHPSVILWGLGNENDWPGDFPVFEKEQIRAFMSELHTLAHELDPTRLTSIRRCDFCADIVDVYSPTIWPGWYSGRYTDYRNMMEYFRKRHPRMMHVEWGGDSHAGRFSENPYATIDTVDVHTPFRADYDGTRPPTTNKINVPANVDWSESYICDLFDWYLTEQLTMPWIAGAANWTFKDFSTPLRPENPVPYVNQKGLVTRDGTPKESYYVFQSHWADKPMVRIFGHDWKIRWGKPGESKQIRVYSNCDEAELFLNGKSLGTRKRTPGSFPAAGLVWEVPLEAGNQQVHVIARKKEGRNTIELSDAVEFEYRTEQWGEPASLRAQVIERGEGYAWVETRLVDADGTECLDSHAYIAFEYAGDGEMICDQGTPDACRLLQAVNGRVRIRIDLPHGGKGSLIVKSPGLETRIVGIE